MNRVKKSKTEEKIASALDKTVERIALHSNPVELVNNMYGNHPDDPLGCRDYFSKVYGIL